MTQVDAIYEHGQFRPLTPVNLPEQAKVSLQIHADDEQPPIAKQIALQKEALRELLSSVHSQPSNSANENISAHDHDQILYGWQK